MCKKVFITTAVLFFCFAGEARRSGHSYVSVVAKGHYYEDVLQKDGGTRLELSPDVTGTLQLRTYRIFSLLLTGGVTIPDDSRTFYGFGFRADLPGIFMFGGNVNDLIHRKRRKGITTYFSGTALVTEMPGQPRSISASRYALGMDIDVDHTFFINIEPSLYSHGGNQMLSIGTGLGIEF